MRMQVRIRKRISALFREFAGVHKPRVSTKDIFTVPIFVFTHQHARGNVNENFNEGIK
jgi:hypothetical protein